MPEKTYAVDHTDGSAHIRTAQVIRHIGIVKLRKTEGADHCWQLDHVPSGKRITTCWARRDAGKLRKQLLALDIDWSDKNLQDSISQAQVSAVRFAVQRFAGPVSWWLYTDEVVT